MGVEVRPLGVKCNIQCQYCYQDPQRDAGNVAHRYDLDRIKAAIERHGQEFTLFGGEALLVPKADLEELWRFGLEKFGKNGIQTNGTLIDDDHLRLFRQYQVQVGISVDGPGELNDVRWAGSRRLTREATARTHAAIERLCREGLPPSLIVTLHKNNATADKLPRMRDWFRHVESLGVTSARLHTLEVENDQVAAKYALDAGETAAAFIAFAELEAELETLKFDVFEDMRRLLAGEDASTTCIWNACDPYATRAVQGIEGDGQSSNCGRTNKDGIDFTKAAREGFERYLALYHTPQRYGGCQGCRFFLACKGNCPGTALDGDWRNRTADCELWYRLLSLVEARLVASGVTPVSRRPDRAALEQRFLDAWQGGTNTYLNRELSAAATSA